MRKGITSLPAATQTPSPQAIAECRRRALAEQGDVWGLLDALSQANPGSLNWKVEFDQILDLMLARSHKHPQKFAGEVLDRLAAVSTFFLLAYRALRASGHAQCRQCRAASTCRPSSIRGRALPAPVSGPRPFHSGNPALPSSIARQWALAKAKEAETDRHTRKAGSGTAKSW